MSASDFEPTQWSLVQGAGHVDPGVRRAALERLCVQYWFPLFAFLRRRGRSPETAADLVQGLFAKLLEREGFAHITQGQGRLRSYLLTALLNHESDEGQRERAQKRGGGRVPISIDPVDGERRLALLGRGDDDPEVALDRAWAREVLQQSMWLLEREWEREGRGSEFAALRSTLEGSEDAPSGAELAAALGRSPVALRVTLHRARARLRELLVRVVADSLGDRREAGEELRALARALGGGGADFQ